MTHNLYLGLGSNLGEKSANIRKALELIDDRIGAVYRVADLIETEPWGYDSPNTYINTVCLVHTMMSPERVLEETQKIEHEMGRDTKSSQTGYQDRTIDIDLLMYDDLQVNKDIAIGQETHNLTLPHPHMKERDFVMKPLKEILQ